MKILVLNGSPKGEYSTTLQCVRYLEILNPMHSFSYLHVGIIEYFKNHMEDVATEVSDADILLFSYPVYTFLAPSQLHQFIELLKEQHLDFHGKVATQITTSKHFYDVTAHTFIEENCQDLGLSFIKGLSLDMDDFTTKKGQETLRSFMDFVLFSKEHELYFRPSAAPCSTSKIEELPEIEPVAKTMQQTVALVCDLAPNDFILQSMVKYFVSIAPFEVKIINIHEFPFKSGCISCFHCVGDGHCIFKDGFEDLLRNEIQTADAIVIAYTIKDHSMGSLFKMYDDRQFCNGHRTVTMGLPFGYLVNGSLSEEPNVKLLMEARAEVGGNYLCGIVTSENAPEDRMHSLVTTLSYAMEHHYVVPSNFLGVGGMKIFRDLIWLMQGMMQCDHKFYKEHNQYDFPQKKRGTILAMYLVGALFKNRKLMKKLGYKINEGMLAPYNKVLEQARKEIAEHQGKES